MWREERLWNVGVLQRVRLSNIFNVYSGLKLCPFLSELFLLKIDSCPRSLLVLCPSARCASALNTDCKDIDISTVFNIQIINYSLK
jgi:hypothetical protein